MSDNLVGQSILGYQIVAEIGEGAFGTVYKAVKSSVLGNYTRAIKHISLPTSKQYASVLNSMGGDTAKTESYFAEVLRGIAEEIELLASLSEKKSNHIVRYYESDLQVQESPLRYDVYMLMEYSTPLSQFIDEQASFTVEDVIKMGVDVLNGIKFCHDNGVIHRDIKEDNIFVSAEGSYEIGDFGVSKVLKDSSRAESLKGTPNYLAPEVYLNKGGYTRSVDLYSLGIVLYRLLNHGRNPFMPSFPQRYFAEDEDKAFELRMKGVQAPPPAMGGAEIQGVIVKAIGNEEERYQDADTFLRDLIEAAEHTSVNELHEPINSPTADTAACELNETSASQSTIRIGIEAVATDCEAADKDGEAEGVMAAGWQTSEKTAHEECEEVCQDTWSTGQEDATAENGSDSLSHAANRPDEIAMSGSKTVKDDAEKAVRIGLTIALVVVATAAIASVAFNIVLTCALAVIAIGVLAALLYFLGRKIQDHEEPNNSALLHDKQPFLMVLEAKADLSMRLLGDRTGVAEQRLRDLELLEERLRYEKEFGCSDATVTNCETDVYEAMKQLQALCRSCAMQENGQMAATIKRINDLLDMRRLLLKR